MPKNPTHLYNAVFYQEGHKLANIQPSAYVVGNMVRRVLKIIREEYATLLGQTGETVMKDSLHRMLTTAEGGRFITECSLIRIDKINCGLLCPIY